MKHFSYFFVFFFLCAVALTGCEVIGDIFKAGVDGSIPGHSGNRGYRLACYQEARPKKGIDKPGPFCDVFYLHCFVGFNNI